MDRPADKSPVKFHSPSFQLPVRVERWEGKEAISELFDFRLDVRVERAAAGQLDRLVGTPASIEVAAAGQKSRWFHGIIRKIAETGYDADFLHCQAVFVPELWFATQNVDCRVFQDKDARKIVEDVLRPYGFPFRIEGDWQLPLNCCVQYLESDLAFVSRLLEEAGAVYRFDHTESATTVVIYKAARHGAPTEVRWDEAAGGIRQEASIRRWQKTLRAVNSAVRLRDRSFQRSGVLEQGSRPQNAELRAGSLDHPSLTGVMPEFATVLEFPGGWSRRFDDVNLAGVHDPGGASGSSEKSDGLATAAERAARHAMQERLGESITIAGGGDVLALSAGHGFRLAGHPHANGDYLAVAVFHRWSAPATDHSGSAGGYENEFKCVPDRGVYFTPRRTPKPQIHGTQTAEVVGVVEKGSQEISCDRYGRVKVKFHWDRRPAKDLYCSCWVRVAQPWAGDNFGSVYIPRIGQEVVVGFENGNPDCPIILGSVYNSEHMPPANLPGDRAAAGFVSRSKKRGDTTETSHLLMLDHPDKEQLHLHSQHHAHISAEHSMVQIVGFGKTSLDSPLARPIASYSSLGSASSDLESAAAAERPKRPSGEYAAPTTEHSSEEHQEKDEHKKNEDGKDEHGEDEGHELGYHPVETDANWGILGHISKVKGRHGEFTLGSSTDILVGAKADATFGFSFELVVAMSVELKFGGTVEMSIGSTRELSIGPKRARVFGNSLEEVTGNEMTIIHGSSYEHCKGDHMVTMFHDEVMEFADHEDDKTVRSVQGNGFSWLAKKPDAFAVHLAEFDAEVVKARAALLSMGAGMAPPTLDAMETQVALTPAVMQARRKLSDCGINLVTEGADINIVAAEQGGKIRLCADEIEIVGKTVNIYREDGSDLTRAPRNAEQAARRNASSLQSDIEHAFEQEERQAKAAIENAKADIGGSAKKFLAAELLLAAGGIVAAAKADELPTI